MTNVTVLIDSLEHDGKRRQPGDQIDIENPEQLLALDAVELTASTEPGEPKKPARIRK